jgi:hypothetical protein
MIYFFFAKFVSNLMFFFSKFPDKICAVTRFVMLRSNYVVMQERPKEWVNLTTAYADVWRPSPGYIPRPPVRDTRWTVRCWDILLDCSSISVPVIITVMFNMHFSLIRGIFIGQIRGRSSTPTPSILSREQKKENETGWGGGGWVDGWM